MNFLDRLLVVLCSSVSKLFNIFKLLLQNHKVKAQVNCSVRLLLILSVCHSVCLFLKFSHLRLLLTSVQIVFRQNRGSVLCVKRVKPFQMRGKNDTMKIQMYMYVMMGNKSFREPLHAWPIFN